jgi:pimeloyl-ACP methyl ester carboxylesterase
MTDHQSVESGAQPRNELIILLHGYSGASGRLSSVRRVVRATKPHADIFNPPLPFSRLRDCMVKAEVLIADLVDQIDGIVAEREQAGGTYERITVVGHSMGAVLARKIVVVAHGEQKDKSGNVPASFEPELVRFREPRSWADRVQRLVLMAGMNRGWTVSSALTWLQSVDWAVKQLIGELFFGGRPTIFAIRRGAPFLVQTRLQWLALMNPAFGKRPNLIAVQLLGTKDDHVAPDDNVDYSVDQFGASSEPSYFYIEVEQSGHSDVVEMGTAEPGSPVEAERRKKFLKALDDERAELHAASITREQMRDTLPATSDVKVDDVVFIVHGIRDRGFWAEKIARTIKRHAGAKRFVSRTQSYGYFAILPFLLRSIRQRKVEWLMDCYTEARALYPDARFHYVGHSNGTYLVTQALRDYPAATFDNIVVAGSVVRRDYDWLSWTQPGDGKPARVQKVLNYVATNDCVVALFPKGLQPWGASLGSAGHDGFDQASPDGSIRNMKYIIGQHGAGHQEDHWNDIARFIVGGEWPKPNYPPYGAGRSWSALVLGWSSAVLFPALIAIVLGFGGLLFWSIFQKLPQPVCHAFSGLAFIPDWKALWSPCTAEISAATTAWRGFFFILYAWAVGLFVLRF